MKCLIDADVLLHEIGWSSQFKDKDSGEEVLLPADHAWDLLDDKIKLIEAECDATEKSTLFVTSSESLTALYNRMTKFTGATPAEPHVTNFRYAVAVSKPYKGTRKNPKPHHFESLFLHMLTDYDVVLSSGGLEADDEISIASMEAQSRGEEVVICSRDKDLRITPGWHYSWECGKQFAVGPHKTDELGTLLKNHSGKVYGYGLSFFLYQLLVGDSADNIPGLPKMGEVKAYKALEPLLGDKKAMSDLVRNLYKETLGDESKEYFLEQAQLLWIRQKRDTPFNLGVLF